MMALIVIGFVITGCVSALVYRQYLLHSANSLLADVKALRLGKSDFADATRIDRKYHRFRVFGSASVPASADPEENVFPANICTPERCFFEFIVDNRPLSSLHLVNGAAFTAVIAVLKGKVEYVEVHLIGGPDPGIYGGIVEEVDPPLDHQPGYRFRTPVGKPYLSVSLTPKAPPAIRDRAFALNMDCLVARRSCDKPCDSPVE